MYKITIENENGTTTTFENVLNWNLLTTQDIETIEEEFTEKKGRKIKLTEEEIKDIEWKLEKFEGSPDMSDLREIIETILKERE